MEPNLPMDVFYLTGFHKWTFQVHTHLFLVMFLKPLRMLIQGQCKLLLSLKYNVWYGKYVMQKKNFNV